MKIQLKRSSVLDGGVAKKPLADQLEYGELAVNYASADPAIFIKDSTNAVVQIAGANSLSAVPTLDQVTDEGNWSSNNLLVGGSPASPVLQLNTTGNVITTGYFRSNKETTSDVVFETQLDSAITFKALGSGSLALGGTIDSTPEQSQANIFLNAESGKIKGITAETTGTITSGGQLIVSAGGANLTGTVTINNSLNVTEGTSLNGTVTMAGDLNVTGNINGAEYNLTTLTELPTA